MTPTGKDITEKIRNGLTPDDVIDRLEHAVPYVPGRPGIAENLGQTNAARRRGALGIAMNVLFIMLANGRRPAREVEEMAIMAGISRSTLRRARVRLGIRSRKEGRPGEPGRWVWEMPQEPQ